MSLESFKNKSVRNDISIADSGSGKVGLPLVLEMIQKQHMTTQENRCTEYGKLPVEFVGSGCEQTGHGSDKIVSSPLHVNRKLQGSWCNHCSGILIIALSYWVTLWICVIQEMHHYLLRWWWGWASPKETVQQTQSNNLWPPEQLAAFLHL